MRQHFRILSHSHVDELFMIFFFPLFYATFQLLIHSTIKMPSVMIFATNQGPIFPIPVWISLWYGRSFFPKAALPKQNAYQVGYGSECWYG